MESYKETFNWKEFGKGFLKGPFKVVYISFSIFPSAKKFYRDLRYGEEKDGKKWGKRGAYLSGVPTFLGEAGLYFHALNNLPDDPFWASLVVASPLLAQIPDGIYEFGRWAVKKGKEKKAKRGYISEESMENLRKRAERGTL